MSSRWFDQDESNNVESDIDKYWHSALVSIEEAIRPLVDIIPNIEASAALAKESCLKSPHGLSHDQSAAIYLYTMETGKQSLYIVLNSILRSNRDVNALPWFSYLKLFSTALRKLPSTSGCVWRAVQGGVAERYRKNIRIRWWAFTSCSKSLSVLKNFVPENGKKGTIFMIECQHGKDISKYSAYKQEDEILLLSGTAFIAVDNSLPMNEMRVVHLKEILTTEPAPVNLMRSVSILNLKTVHEKKQQKPVLKLALPKAMPSALPPKPPAEKTSKKFSCPHCSTALVLSGSNSQGTRTVCCTCQKAFNEVTCPHCHQSNFWRNANYHAGRKVTCAYCKNIFQHLNCPHCQHAAFWWEQNEHQAGRKTHCRWCNKEYRALNCPHCDAALYFKDDRYKAGLRYKCSHCENTYQTINCPHCSKLNIWKNADRKAGLRTTCGNCNNSYQHINCPKCSAPSVWKNANRIPGYRVTCHECQTIFQHLNCPHCQASHVWTDGVYEQRTQIRCVQCQNQYQHVTCPRCKAANYFPSANLKSDERVVCYNCKETF